MRESMKTNLKMFAMLFASLLIGLTACDKKQDDLNNGEATGDYGYMSLSLQLPNAGSLLGVDDKHQGEEYVGTVPESKVSEVLIGFYKGTATDAVCSANINLQATLSGTAGENFTGADVADNSTSTKLVTKAVEVPQLGATEKYQIVVFFNPTDEVKGLVTKGRSLSDLQRSANYDQTKVVTANGIMMSNAQGLIEIEKAILKETPALAEAATDKVNIKVERAVAKVFVNPAIGEPAGQGNISGAKLALKGWTLDVINKKFFNIRKQADALKTSYSTNQQVATETEPETTTTLRVNAYAEDPNFTTSGTYSATDFTYLNQPYSGTNPATMPTFYETGWDDDKGHYVSENTMQAVNQQYDATTLAIFKIEVTPKELVGSTETSYVVYKNKVLKVADFKDKVTASETKTDAEIEMPSGFQEDVNLFADGGKTGQEVLNDKIDAGEAFTQNNVNFYVGLVNYYKMPIRHFTNEQQPKRMAYGRFGIVRNNIYKLTVNKVSNFGDPVIPEPGHDDDEKEVGYLSMSVDLLPWLVRESDYNL